MASIAVEKLDGTGITSCGMLSTDIQVQYDAVIHQVSFKNKSATETYKVMMRISHDSSMNGVFITKEKVFLLQDFTLATNKTIYISPNGILNQTYNTVSLNDAIILTDITFTRQSDNVDFGANMNNQRLYGKNRILLTEVTTQTS